jgi:arylsulfatase A-like enzyme
MRASLLLLGVVLAQSQPPPNLVFILTDDMCGRPAHDARRATRPCAQRATRDARDARLTLPPSKTKRGYGVFNGAAKIPNLDALRAEGVTSDMYSYRFCSPSRASFLTGRFPWRVSSTICDARVCNYLPATTPMGVHLGYSMLPARLAEKRYLSYHVGKWHEGLYAPQFTPLYRGFNRSNGFLSGGSFNAHNAAPARCARNCDPNEPKNQPYARSTTLNQQARTTTRSPATSARAAAATRRGA